MAKSPNKSVSFSSLSSLVENISKKTSILIDKDQRDQSFISTGIMIMNALLSKSIKKGGVSKNRITVFAGPPGCGKSYICYNVSKNAQDEGYNIIYIDTEYSIEKSELIKFGVDVSEDRFMLIRSNKVEELKILLVQLLDELVKEKNNGKDVGKTLIILDSIGQLASAKEIDDALEGKNKVDMSRAKAIKSLFRSINSNLGYLDIPMICTNHVYMSQDLFPQMIMGGGEGAMYSASTVIYMTISKLKTGDEVGVSKEYVKDTGQSGILITAKSRKNRLAKPMQIKFEINYDEGTNPYKGLEFFCTPENFEQVGIAKVKVEKDKKGNITSVKEGGTKYYVRHLDKYFYEKQLFNSQIFNKDIIDILEPIIYEYFDYASYEERNKMINELNDQYSESEDGFDIDTDSEELFE